MALHIPDFKYEPNVCSFKTWLLNLTRWRIVDQLRKRPKKVVVATRSNGDGAATAMLERVPDPASLNLDAVWDKEWEQHLLSAAIQSVKRKVNPEQYQIFHLCVFKEWPVQKVTRELGISATRVYLAKHRVAALLKREVKLLEKKINGATNR